MRQIEIAPASIKHCRKCRKLRISTRRICSECGTRLEKLTRDEAVNHGFLMKRQGPCPLRSG